MVSGHQQRCSNDAGHDEVGGLNESKEKENDDDEKCNEAKLLVKDAAATATATATTATAGTMLLSSAVSKEEEEVRGNNSTIKTSSLDRKRSSSRPASSSVVLPILKRAKVLSSNKTEEWDLTPVSMLLRILGYLDNTTLMLMCLVCKQIRDIIWTGQGMETKLVRIFELSLSENNFDDNGQSRARWFVFNMNQYFQNSTKTRILQGFQHWKIQDLKEFNDNRYEHIRDDELERLTQNIRMTGIVALDMSSSLPTAPRQRQHQRIILYRAISCMVPNLRKLDLSHTCMHPCNLGYFAVRCPRLEIIRWNYNGGDMSIDAKCDDLQFMNNLKELYLDNWCFGFDHYRRIDENRDTVDVDDDDDNDNSVTEIEAMSDSNNYPNVFLFCRLCNKPLERISIRNARCMDPDWAQQIIPQNVLMKFVRKAPETLVWFRSDLSPENIRILQSERPGIQLLN